MENSFRNFLSKKQMHRCILGIMYLVLFIPYFYSIYYSVPASDDFAFGADTCSDNLFANAILYSIWNWKYHSGRWLIFIIQKIINPLNLHVHLGHIYGVYMIILFIFFTLIIMISIDEILLNLLNNNYLMSKWATFIIIAMFYTTYYYVEVYNWYVGATAYAFPIALLLLTIALCLKYLKTHDKKIIVWIMIAALVPATNEFCDVPLGILYIYVMFVLFRKTITSKKEVITRLIPLTEFILLGISVVFAPGNFVRQSVYGVDSNIGNAAKQAAINITYRIMSTITNKPWVIAMLLLLVLLGAISNSEKKKSLNILLLMVVCWMVTFGAIFPYMYGRNFTNTYMDVRMQYVMGLFIVLSISIMSIVAGQEFVRIANINITKKYKIISIAIIGTMFLGGLLRNEAYLTSVPVDIYNQRDLIKTSYVLWDGILSEIDDSPADDVIVHRESDVLWSPYFLYSGLVSGETFNVDFDEVYSSKQIMLNVYYQKKSVTLFFDKTFNNKE